MSKIFNYYSDDIDRTWYNSTNIKYSECIDKEGELKILNVVFSNGTQYQYKGVKVQDYLLFREDASQGKALNKFIKGRGYEFERLDDANIEDLMDEYEFRTGKGLTIDNNDGNVIKIIDNSNKEICEINFNDTKPVDITRKLLESLGYVVREKK